MGSWGQMRLKPDQSFWEPLYPAEGRSEGLAGLLWNCSLAGRDPDFLEASVLT